MCCKGAYYIGIDRGYPHRERVHWFSNQSVILVNAEHHSVTYHMAVSLGGGNTAMNPQGSPHRWGLPRTLAIQ